MGGSKSQTVGYTYFKGLMAVIGNRIEQLLDINPNKKGWIMTPEQKQQLKAGRASVNIDKPNLFGGDKKEGGWVGAIDVYVGEDGQPQNAYLANQINEDVSAYPNLSYLVFHGQNSLDKGFQLVSMSGMMKEFMLWVKRIHVKNDDSTQWYDIKSEIGKSINGLSEKEYNEKVNKLPPQNNEWFGTKNIDDQFVKFTGNGLISGYVHDFNSQYGYIGKVGHIKTTFSKDLAGLQIKLTIWADDGISSFNWAGGDYKIIREFSVAGFITCRDYLLDCYTDDLSLFFSIIDGVPSGSTTNHKVNIFTSVPKFNEYDDYVDSGLDINPIHKIREILTDYTAMGKPESDINDDNFRFMADRIYTEGLGVSWCIQQKSCKEALEELEYHIEGGVRINRQTGLYEVILFRDDLLNLDDALHFDESNIKSFQPDIINAEDQINAVNVSFYDRENIKDSSFSLSDVGSFHTIDHENAEDLKFPYFMDRRNAEKVANWKLKQLSTVAWKGTFTTGKYEARKLNKYDVVLLSWKSKNIVNLPVRVMNINLGNGQDNTVTLDFVEVVPYSNFSYSSINVDPNPNPILPPQPNSSIVFEMPYFEAVQRMGQTSVDTELANNPEIGYLMTAAIKPQDNSLSALLYTDGGSNTLDLLEEVGVVDYCAGCNLDQDISFIDTSFAVKNVQDLSRVKAGTLVQVNQELLVYQSYDAETKVLTVKRGALDTIPKPHSKDAVFYFWDDSSGLDQTAYIDGETIHAKVLTTTPSGVENLSNSAVRTLEIKGRANRPYPPANVKINGEYWPEEIEGDLVLTWADRNRVQQTGGVLIGWSDDGITKESGVKYAVDIFSNQTNTLLASIADIDANSVTIDASVFEYENRIELYSVRDAYESFQRFVHVFTHGVAKWTPDLSIAKIFLLSDDLELGTVSTWKDRKTGVNFTQTSNSKKPLVVGIGEQKVVRFDGVDDLLSTTNTAITSLMQNVSNAWIFAVYKQDGLYSDVSVNYRDVFRFSTSSTSSLFALFASTPSQNYKPAVGARRLAANAAQFCSATSGSSVDSVKMILGSADYVNQNFKIHVNTINENTLTASFGSGTTANEVATCTIGGYLGAANETFKGDIHAIVMGNTALNLADQQKLEGWAAWKYDLVGNLPVDHPFKYRAPTMED